MKLNQLLFSIITVSYNSELTITDTIESVLNQDYIDFEYIIVDGNSHDGTLKIIENYQDKFKQKGISYKFTSESDSGIYDAMNKGMAEAQGTFIGILNSDDVYANPQVLSSIASIIQNNNPDVVYADLVYVDSQNLNKVKRHWKSGKYNIKNIYWGWIPPHPTFFIKYKQVLKIGNYNDSLSIAADYEFMLRALLKYKLTAYYHPEINVKMRLGGTSNANLRNRIKGNQNIRDAWAINGLTPKFYTFFFRLLRKLPQYL